MRSIQILSVELIGLSTGFPFLFFSISKVLMN